MNPILIEPNQSILDEQYQFLIKREFYVRYSWAKKPGYYFLGWLVALAVFNFITGSNRFVTLKVVLLTVTSLAFLVVLAFATVVVVNWRNRHSWKRKIIRHAIQNKTKYWLTFNESDISFSTDIKNSSIKWEHFKYYKEVGDSIYIFPDKIYESIACSKSEIGIPNYDQLKGIVQEKLEVLD
jgi:hypothetical protein